MKKFLLFGLLILFIGTIVAFALKKDEPSFENPKAHYKEYCAGCHGEQLKSFVNRKWIYGNSWNEVFASIKEGYPDDGMPAYDTAFTDQQIGELTDYILNGIESITQEYFDDDFDLSGIIESEEMKFEVEEVVGNLGVPWGLAFLPNGDMLITERSGKFHRYRAGEKLHAIRGVPEVAARGQGGLMDVELHPNFSENKWIYLSYSKPKGNEQTTAILRAKLENDRLIDQKVILEAAPYSSRRIHFGSRLEFDRSGYLFLSVGDRGRRDQNPQSLDNHCGKIHRVHDDGSIPEDNPFVNTSGAVGSIYSYGHRNPQGLARNPATGQIWAHEHGPRGGDEVNLIQKGKNYGWPVISYGINYSGTQFTNITEKEGMMQPELYWVPSIAACGLTFVHGDRYPAWKGDLLAGSLRFQYIARLKMENNKIVGEEKLVSNIGRVRDIKMGHDGLIYFTVEGPGRVFRIVPAP